LGRKDGMMEGLIKTICEKTGISEAQARQVLELVSKHLGDKLPAPVAGQVTKLLGDEGAGEAAEEGQGLLSKVGGLLGKKD
jgi:hypothetical protein